MLPPPPTSPLFPYTTLFRSPPPPADASDADLLVRIADRDRDAFELLYHRHVRSAPGTRFPPARSEEHTSELQSRPHLVCRLLLEKKNTDPHRQTLRPYAAPT